MIQHFYENNVSSLCCQPKDIKERISKLTVENIADIKSLPSIAKYLKASNAVASREELSDKEFMVCSDLFTRVKKDCKNYSYCSNGRIHFNSYVIKFKPLKNFNTTAHYEAI